MRKSVLVLAFFLCFGGVLKAQDKENMVTEGDIVVLGETQGMNYSYIHFPRKNFIIKRGAIPNFNALIGKKLVVENIDIDRNGKSIAVLRRKDGQNFFRFYPTVKVDISQALENGEIRRQG